MKKLLAFIVAAILCLSCFAACGKKNEAPQNNESTPTQVVYDVEDATAYLKNMYKKYLTETETAADFTLVSQVMKGGVVYKVTWTTDREDIKVIADEANKQVKIDLDEKTKVDIAYKLTATITDPDGKTATLTFELKVPKYVLSTWEEYMAMEDGKAVVVEGYIAAVHAPSEGNKYNTLYLHDVNNKGGYYIYSMADDKDLVKDLGLKNGMLVSVTGTKTIYSGTHEIKDAVVNVLDTTVVDLKPLDITATYKAATTLKDKALTDKLGMLVTIKGVEITDQDLSEKSMYLNFKLAGLTSYLRVYATDCPASVTDAGQKSIIEEHGKKKGYFADVTGVVVMYSGAIYLNPVSDTPFAYGKKIERTPEQMVEVEMDEVKFDKDIALNKTIELPSKGNTYEDVVITWTSNSEAIIIEDGVAKITLQAEATTASITGTFTLGTIVKTKTFEFNLSKKSTVVPQNAANPVPGVAYKFFYTQTQLGEYRYFGGTAGQYYLNTTNDINAAVDVYLEAATGGYYLYYMDGETKTYINAFVAENGKCNSGTSTTAPANVFKLDAELENAPIITLTAGLGEEQKTGDYFLGTYGDRTDLRPSEYKYAAQGNYVAHLGTVVDSSKISDTDKVATEKEGLSIESDEFFTDAEINLDVKGSIYDDVTITWSSNNAAAVVNGGKLNITLGDEEQTVTLTATLTCGTVTETKTFTIKLKAAGITLTDIPTLNTIGAGQAQNVLTTTKYFTKGKITSIDNTTYGNMYIEDDEGNKLYVYGLYIDGKKYGEATTKPVVGDYIIINGAMTSYSSKAQMKNANLIENLGKYPVTDFTTLNTIGAAQAQNALTTDKYYATGKIKSIVQATYGNMYIEDAEGNELYIYGLYINGAKYGDATTKPVVGDTIVVYGAMTSYNSKAQMKNADLVELNGTAIGGNEDDDDNGVVYNMSDVVANHTSGNGGTQYAAETYVLDSKLTMDIKKCHLHKNGEVRIYASDTNDGIMILKSTSAIDSIKFTVKSKDAAASFDVYGSADGETYTKIQTVNTTTSAANYTVTISDSTYRFIKVDANVKQQIVTQFVVNYK